MKPILHLIVSLFMFTFITTSMFGSGAGLTFKEVISPLRRIQLIARLLIANFIFIPSLAYLMSILLRLDPSTHAAIIILSCCAGSPFFLKLIKVAKSSHVHSTGLMIMLIGMTIICLTFLLPLIFPGASVNPLRIAMPLIFLMLLPLGLGLITRAWQPKVAARLGPIMEKVSSISVLLMIIPALYLDGQIFIDAWGTGAYNVTFLLIVIALLVGYICGGSSSRERFLIMMASGTRQIEAALVVAIANFPDPRVFTVVLIGALVEIIMLFIIAFLHGKFRAAGA